MKQVTCPLLQRGNTKRREDSGQDHIAGHFGAQVGALGRLAPSSRQRDFWLDRKPLFVNDIFVPAFNLLPRQNNDHHLLLL